MSPRLRSGIVLGLAAVVVIIGGLRALGSSDGANTDPATAAAPASAAVATEASDTPAERSTSPVVTAEAEVENSSEFLDLVSPQRRVHILDGDRSGGGHRYGTGKPGKSEFPADWSDDKIIHIVSTMTVDDTLQWEDAGVGPRGDARFRIERTVDGIDVLVIYEPEGEGVITAYPTNVERNPR